MRWRYSRIPRRISFTVSTIVHRRSRRPRPYHRDRGGCVGGGAEAALQRARETGTGSPATTFGELRSALRLLKLRRGGKTVSAIGRELKIGRASSQTVFDWCKMRRLRL